MTPQEMVREFHEAIGAPILSTPTIPSTDHCLLRCTLLTEESEEACAELLSAAEGDGNLARIAKELADVLIVTYGTALEFGIDLDAVMAEVHKSNMSKVGGPRRSDGKQLKPKGWEPPDIAGVLGL